MRTPKIPTPETEEVMSHYDSGANNCCNIAWGAAEDWVDSGHASATVHDLARFHIAISLQKEATSPNRETGGLYTDLISCALRRVDWHHIATVWLDRWLGIHH